MKPAVARHGRGASAFGGGPGRSSRGIDGRPRRQIDPGTAGPIKDRILLKLTRQRSVNCIGSVRLVDLQHARWPGRLRFSFPSLGGADLANSTHLISQFEKILCALSVSQETPIILFARRNWPPPLQPGRGHFAVPNAPSNTPAPALPRRGAVRSESRALPWPVPLPERWGRP
jgi:hypothetical protein